ncbi:hypothetical protein EJ03DRAFT_9879 [Teratosphaeria nubilosa]|uniref:Secreted protein n=1 Tax=Teratosphaeria nubilosa TaxID=161662 RepID=A0A6G1LG38_9PEZI|nr:hypothetical protein EJ03DRAFT_9879 [Teratosphaeria nubilosa]
MPDPHPHYSLHEYPVLVVLVVMAALSGQGGGFGVGNEAAGCELGGVGVDVIGHGGESDAWLVVVRMSGTCGPDVELVKGVVGGYVAGSWMLWCDMCAEVVGLLRDRVCCEMRLVLSVECKRSCSRHVSIPRSEGKLIWIVDRREFPYLLC